MAESLTAAFAAMPKRRSAIAKKARAQVKKWVKYADVCIPCDPEPLRWPRNGFKEAKEAKDGKNRCGFDAQGRLLVEESPTGHEYFVHAPEEIWSYRYETTGEPVVVRWLKREPGGRVVEKRSKAKGSTLHDRLIWEGDRLVRVDTKGSKGWSVAQTLDWSPDGKLVRIWRENAFRPGGKEVLWGKRFPK